MYTDCQGFYLSVTRLRQIEEKKSLSLTCVKQVLHFNKKSRFLLFVWLFLLYAFRGQHYCFCLWFIISGSFVLLVLIFKGLFCHKSWERKTFLSHCKKKKKNQIVSNFTTCSMHLRITALVGNCHCFILYLEILVFTWKKHYFLCRLISHCTAVRRKQERMKACNSQTAACGPILPSFPSMSRSTAPICSCLLISCIFNWAVYLKKKKKSIEVLAAVWSLSGAPCLP